MQEEKKFTAFHRLLHWLMALAMPVLFVTGFLRMYWMNKNHIVSVIESKTAGISISKETMVSIAKDIRELMWNWHVVFAHVMIFSVLARIIYMVVKGIRFPNPFIRNQPFKEKLQGFTYIYFYVFVLISAVTGICLRLGLFTAWKEWIETVHKLGIYWFPIFIVLHFAGIIIAEYSAKRGIVSRMIGGEGRIKN